MKCTCGVEMIEDEMFACGAVIMITGHPSDLKREKRFICKKCKNVEYVAVENMGSIVDFLKEPSGCTKPEPKEKEE